MDITIENRENCTILFLKGRLDTEAARVLDQSVDLVMSGHETNLVLDLSSVPYLSSGGIRAVNKAYQAAKKKKGTLILAGTTEFPGKVLEMSGFSRVFHQVTTVEEAVRAMAQRSLPGPGQPFWETCYETGKYPLAVCAHRLSEGESSLISAGPWRGMHLASLKTEDLKPLQFHENNYSLGIGAFGPSAAQSLEMLGDMVVAGNMVAWAPPGGGTADYFFRDSSRKPESPQSTLAEEIPGAFYACSLALEGDMQEVLVVEPGTGLGKYTLGDLYAILASRAREQDRPDTGVIAVKILARTLHPESLVLQKPPIELNRPKNREFIQSQVNGHEWFQKLIPSPAEEQTSVMFGIICDSTVKSGVNRELIDRLFPGSDSAGDPGILSHMLCISMKPVDWEPDIDIDHLITMVESGGEITGISRLTDETGLARAVIGVSYIDSLREEGPAIEFEEPCPEWIGPYDQITRHLHRGSTKVVLSRISGGYSGSLVFRVHARDRSGRKQMPFVMKIGQWSLISDEIRGYSEYVERYILNSSTKLIQHAKMGDYGGILYNFVGIGESADKLISLDEFYRSQPPGAIEGAFDHLFRVVLNTWYGQPSRSEYALYREYMAPPLYTQSRDYACTQFGASPSDPTIELPCNLGKSANPLYFIEHVIPSRTSFVGLAYLAPQHGDLNLKNVLLDQKGHMWLIDFSDTRVSHNLRDIAKMETVIRTEMAPYSSDTDVCVMAGLDNAFLSFRDLGDIPGMPGQDLPPDKEKAFRVMRKLRYYANLVTILDDTPEQYLLALLWYTLPVLWYQSVGEYGKKYAWITASRICARLQDKENEYPDIG